MWGCGFRLPDCSLVVSQTRGDKPDILFPTPFFVKKCVFLQKNFKMTISLPDNILSPLMLTEADIRLELAVTLYRSGKLSFGKSRELAGLNWFQFRQLLTDRQIPAHYDAEDFELDLKSIATMP
jgi:predicted HTH domain antitoxin